MKSINLYILGILVVVFSSCELDNYDGPNAKFFGTIIDSDTGEAIPQDLIQGATIEYVEQGFENPEIQQLRFKADGSFRNNLMFAGEYAIQAVRGNFFTPESDTIMISGDRDYSFNVQPYIRVKDVNVALSGDGVNVIATFSLEQVAGEPVASIIMVSDVNPSVGVGIRTQTNEIAIGTVVDPATVHTLWLPAANYQAGKEYYFRVGALIARPEAKYNFNTAIRFSL